MTGASGLSKDTDPGGKGKIVESKPIAAGKSSFDLIDVEKVFTELRLKPGTAFLDVACGRGAYSLAASKYVGPEGHVYAVDLWEEGIVALQKELATKEIRNLSAHVADVSRHIPVGDQSIDSCLVATVLHELLTIQKAEGMLSEVQRVMKAGGTIAVIEFKKIEGPPGPPIGIRITNEALIETCRPFAMAPIKTLDVGPYNYLTLFTRQGSR
jgi:ubiquinone/menaquinone biosynthesis C-methylase UbiE